MKIVPVLLATFIASAAAKAEEAKPYVDYIGTIEQDCIHKAEFHDNRSGEIFYLDRRGVREMLRQISDHDPLSAAKDGTIVEFELGEQELWEPTPSQGYNPLATKSCAVSDARSHKAPFNTPV